ncbi:AfsR/SARP family transcriptional regulator [Streptomyces sp. NBC_01754]|uniref:AfsR/SARP family transcriptional regulator n=1 Tax=Streptomyces sp. NBC_01754 TaxID=2975930 RepID=UPI002DDC00A7|nr:AfsR/SARP family transcriptional regulator [Streptomyces sp. NBC_01754]WSC95525.1 AfsR/SARP family transcriptional regulator [Streptomyces sp. NBC_01754]
MGDVTIGLLGPLVVTVNGASVVPSAAKPRCLLALLAASPGREVGMAAIADELWEERPPGGPTATVQTYIKQLRGNIAAALGPAPGVSAHDVLSRGHTGYQLNVPAGGLDTRQFEREARRGTRTLGEGDSDLAARLLATALSRWRGPALDGVRRGPALRAEALRLEEARLTTLETRITADLMRGRHTELVSELIGLTSRHPLVESLHAQLMLALHRSGRSSQALEVFRRLRETYVRELGLEPSRRLQELHRSVLADAPQLDAPMTSLAAF